MIVHQIEALVAAGVKDIVLAVNYRPEIMEKFLAEVSSELPLTATPPPILPLSPRVTTMILLQCSLTIPQISKR